MLLNFKNKDLVSIINLLTGIELKGKLSRSRTKVANILMDSLTELQEDEKKLLAEFSEKDEEGNVKMLDDQTYDVKKENEADLIKAKNELLEETISIDPVEKLQHFTNLKETLDNLDILLKDNEAVAYDLILTELENGGIE